MSKKIECQITQSRPPQVYLSGVACSSPNGLFALSAVLGRCEARFVACSMTALKVWLLERRDDAGGSRNGLCSSRGGLVTGVCGLETLSGVLLMLEFDDGFRLLPTRTT